MINNMHTNQIDRFIRFVLLLTVRLSFCCWKKALALQQPSLFSRRTFSGLLVAGGGSCGAAIAIFPDSASARDDLFKPNPLTNPMLEQLRIWNQAEADTIKYQGELERGDAKSSDYVSLLVPILQIAQELHQVEKLIQNSEYERAVVLLSDKKYEKISFKKTFNRYGDNIYYSDPERANAYLGGGATPKATQSLAYLLRNDILTNLEDLQAELRYVQKQNYDVKLSDAPDLIKRANDSMEKYLDLVPPQELEEARKVLN